MYSAELFRKISSLKTPITFAAALLSCALLVIFCLAGCIPDSMGMGGSRSADKKAKVWVASDMVALTDWTVQFADDSILANISGRSRINLFSACNETVSFQVIVDAPSTGESKVSIAPEAFYAGQPGDKDTPIITADSVQIFRMLPVHITKFPAWYLRLVDTEPQAASFYDALVPINAPQVGQPYMLKPNKRLAFWVDVTIPRNATPGLYTGHLNISTGFGEKTKFEIELKVYDFVLPDTLPLAACGGFDHRTVFREFITQDGKPYSPEYLDVKSPKIQDGLKIIRQLMQLSHSHHLDIFDRELRPKITRDLNGKLVLDWEDFDKIVGPYISGQAYDDKIAISAWPVPYYQNWPVPKYYGGIDSDTYAATARGIVTECVEHFREQLKSQEQIFAWPYRGKVSAKAYDEQLRFAEIIRQAAPTLPVLCELPMNPPAMTGWKRPDKMESLVDILAPPAQWFDPDDAARLKTPKNPLMGIWLSPGLPPYLPSLSVTATPADVRAIPWFAMKYNCSGIFLPEVLNWSGDVFNTPAGAGTRLFYPGKDMGIEGVLPSVRLKRFRRGMQDISYLWILRQRQQAKVAKDIIDSMARYAGLAAAGDNYLDPRIGGWLQHGPTWIHARKLLAEEILAAIYEKGQTPEQKIAAKVRWQQFSSKAHTVRVERVRAHMTFGLASGTNDKSTDVANRPWRATILVDLYNEYDRSLDALLEITSVPAGWKGLVTRHRILNFSPGGQRVAKLVIEGKEMPITANGKIPVELKLTTNAPSETVMKTDVPFVYTSAFRKPPVIDGSLNDWPVRPANSAGDFRLLGKRGQKIGQAERMFDKKKGLAERQTVAFAMVDKENLYFAIRCEEPNLDGMHFNSSNVINYEQLLACGEDLVEIVLDPGVKAKGPEDLFHIIVKPNGVTVQEKGIRSTPPLGRAVPFPLDATVAVGRLKNAWVVEMKIPRSSFGPIGEDSFWGVNFTRFSTQGMEASSWSGASRYFYDPKTLGTMFVLQPVEE